MEPTLLPSPTSPSEHEGDVVAMLLDAHVLARDLLRRALRFLEGEEAPMRGRLIAASMHRFLTLWSPMHEIDEEQTLIPAIETFAPGVANRALRRIVPAHEELDALRGSAALAWLELERSPASYIRLHPTLDLETKQVVRVLVPHMAHEEAALFPLVDRHVPKEHRQAMQAVMLARRRTLLGNEPSRPRAEALP